MAEIRHRVGINAPASDVYEWLTTTDGLAGWWTRDVTGEGGVGSTLRFSFGGEDRRADMQVTELDPAGRVVWRCVYGPDEWIGTDIVFELTPNGDETVLLFTHANWREPVEFLNHCSTKWALFLFSLKDGLEGRVATPYPKDPAISSWG
jgi:uncharacterized protein YndB with AHSA1/START domain